MDRHNLVMRGAGPMTDTTAGCAETHSGEPLAANLEAVFRDLGIPPRPTILQHLANEMRQPDPDFNRVAQLIGRDVSLAAGLIKTVNSPYFGLKQKVRSVREALMIQGLSSATRTIAGLALRQVFPPGPHLERFWDAADRTAQLSGWLVHVVGIKYGIQHEDAYTYALFRDCGIPILIRRFPDYKETLALANSTAEVSFTSTEETRLPTNHAIVGSLMTQSWWLPEMTSAAIRHHHEPTALTTGMPVLGNPSRHLIALAQLAEYLFQQASGLNQTVEWQKMGDQVLDRLGLETQELPALQLRAAAFLDSVESI